MRWPSCERSRSESVRVSEPFVFGIHVFGADGSTFPFLAKCPRLGEMCGNFVHTLTAETEFLDETPLLEALGGTDTGDADGLASSTVPGWGGVSGGGMGGNGGDETVGGDGGR